MNDTPRFELRVLGSGDDHEEHARRAEDYTLPVKAVLCITAKLDCRGPRRVNNGPPAKSALRPLLPQQRRKTGHSGTSNPRVTKCTWPQVQLERSR